MKLYVRWYIIKLCFHIVSCRLYGANNGTLQENDIKHNVTNQSKVSCILDCESDSTCTRIGYEHVDAEDIVGNCLHMKENEPETISFGNFLKNVTVFVKSPPPCLQNPCAADQRCIDTFGGASYQCRCTDGFSGEKCSLHTGKGSSKETPHSSCLNIRLDYTSNKLPSQYYWISIQNTTVRMFCDMDTISGGWTQITNLTNISNIPFDSYIHSDPLSIGLMETKQYYAMDSIGLKILKDSINATQLRVYCFKPNIGRTVHLVTKDSDLGKNVLSFYAFETSTNPAACNSFQTLSDDDSWLAQNCQKWQYDRNVWGHATAKVNPQRRLYDHLMYVHPYHLFWLSTDSDVLCDDINKKSSPATILFYIR